MFKFTCGASHGESDPRKFGQWTYSGLVGLAHNPTDLSHVALGEGNSTRPVKPMAHWFMPNDCRTKRKDDVEASGNFGLLVADIDDGNLDPSDVANVLLDLGVESFVIYDTLSSTVNARRHRVVIELARTVGGAEWFPLQRALMVLLDADSCTLSPNQISYMPTLSACNAECYTVTFSDGQALDPERSRFALEAGALNAVTSSDEPTAPKHPTAPARHYDLSVDESRDPISVFNQVNNWDAIISHCGIKRMGSRLLPPTSESGVPGAIISHLRRPAGAYFSRHTSDLLADGLPHDMFDVWMVHGLGLNHRSPADVARASTEFARNYRLPDGYTLEAKNRYLYAIKNKHTPTALVNSNYP
ncbi:hypothetical protein L4C36_20730 [Photobacterium japonica]|uniref:hypothetical protein n=1 Tax=Photobacterium japonica TaxID=2910235 RepID=UPI003D0BCFFD